MARKLVATVFVTDPDTGETVRLDAGSKPDKRLAAMVTNPDAWGRAAKDDDEPQKGESGD